MDTFWKALLLAAVLITAWGVMLGWSRKAVFFMDTNDLVLSFVGWITLVFSIFLGMSLGWPWLNYFGAVIAAYFIFETIRRAFLHNNNDWRLALPVGVGKILLSFIYTATWVQALGPGGKNATQRRENRAMAFLAIGLLTLLLNKLINGEAVLERRNNES